MYVVKPSVQVLLSKINFPFCKHLNAKLKYPSPASIFVQ